jgi:hypothetical protein
MNNNEQIEKRDPLTESSRRIKAIVKDAVREALQEERRRFDPLKFIYNIAKKIAGDLESYIK